MYSLSTCWNSHRHTDGRAMLREIRELGFQQAELSHGIRISLLPGILEALDAGEMRISTVHNFCPLPLGINHAAPNVFKFTAEDPRERDNAWRHTLKTLETAERVKAALVVLHLGRVEVKEHTDKLIELAERGGKGTPKYERLCQDAQARLEEKKGPFVARMEEMVRRLEPEAARRGLKLGIENREALEELPLESDFFFFFKEFTGATINYWHDTGHAQIKENLGFIHHAMHLESVAERLAGFHIHDVEFPARDHRPPGRGTVDFAALKPLVRPDHIKVFEFSPTVTVEELKAGVAHIRSAWGDE